MLLVKREQREDGGEGEIAGGEEEGAWASNRSGGRGGRNGDTWKGDTTTNQSVLSTDRMRPLGRQTTEMELPVGDGRLGTAEGKSRVAPSGRG